MIQFPFKSRWVLTQGYHENANNYPEGRHGGLDIVPMDDKGNIFPADIYSILPGVAYFIANDNPRRGKGLRVRSEADKGLIKHLQDNNVLPKGYSGVVYVDSFYWHCLEVTDTDGKVDTAPIAKAGNTGWVFSKGKQVPDEQKGVPPYPGLHLHFEITINGNGILFNKDKDPLGRIDPYIIFNYKQPIMRNETKVVLSKNSETVWICQPVPEMDYLMQRANLEGFEIPRAILEGDKFKAPTTDDLF